MGQKHVIKRRHPVAKRLIGMNLGWMKVVGELEKRTKSYTMIRNVLEMRINPINYQIGVFPMDYPLNTEVLDFMKIYERKIEYGSETMKEVRNKYYEILNYIKGGIKDIPVKLKMMDKEIAQKLLEQEEIH